MTATQIRNQENYWFNRKMKSFESLMKNCKKSKVEEIKTNCGGFDFDNAELEHIKRLCDNN